MKCSSESIRSSLLSDVVANFLRTLSEAEFFEAFGAILRANGFYDIHLLHGPVEHGKDFIAKRIEGGVTIQYAIQTKVGDVNTTGWREARNQIETIRTSTLSHPADDYSLSRQAVLAMTGRLVGQAPTESQNYKTNYDSATFAFEVWQLNDLLTMMTDAPEAGLAGEPDAPLLGAVAAIYEGTFTEENLEALSRGWCNPVGETNGIWRAALAALVLSHRLAIHGRHDMAALVGVHLVRAAWARCADKDPAPPEVIGVAEAGRGLLLFHARVLLDAAQALPEEPERFVMSTASFADFVVYPVRCLRLLELIGLAGLATDDHDLRREAAEFLAEYVRLHPGASHPISDHWAVCIPPAALLIHEVDPDLVGSWLQQLGIWLADHYEKDQAGLAQPWTPPEEEVLQLLLMGVPVARVERRPDSFLAAILLDLAAILELTETYEWLVNEIVAVQIFPSVVEANEGTGFYQDNFGDVFIEPWVQYDETFATNAGWQSSDPHRCQVPAHLQRVGRTWDLMALSSVLRDRWFPLAWRELAGVGTGGADTEDVVD
jgi:hypothetical protein